MHHMGNVASILDDLVRAQFDSPEFQMSTSWDSEACEYRVSSEERAAILLGQAHELHIWLELPCGWRLDSHDEDVSGLVDEFDGMLRLGAAFLRGHVLLPPAHATNKRWEIPEYGVILRRLPAKKRGLNPCLNPDQSSAERRHGA